MSPCPACGGPLAEGVREWHACCPACTYEGSTLQPHILEQRAGGDLDEHLRGDALRTLRDRNFDAIAGWIRRLAPRSGADGGRPKLLDVGCAHGWFLDRMRTDFEVTGIEPDPNVALEASRGGITVHAGFFPDVLAPDDRQDVIVFNDVLEHIPDVNATLAACKQHLQPGGLLVVNAPDRRGFLYRLSRVCDRVGLGGWFDRLWQAGFPSPHVHYFDTASMTRIAGKHGFELVESHRLPSVALQGLYSRIRYSRDTSLVGAIATTAAVAAMVPMLAVLPSDITVWVFRRP